MDTSGWGLLPHPRKLQRIVATITDDAVVVVDRAKALQELWSSSFEEITALTEWPHIQQSIMYVLFLYLWSKGGCGEVWR